MILPGSRSGWTLLLAVIFAVIARPARAQDLTCGAGDLEVMRMTFSGNHAFSAGVLADGIVTAPSNYLRRTIRFIGTRRCLDRDAFPLDRIRLIVFYHNHGYASVTVDTIVTSMGLGRIAVRFAIREGEPTMIDSLSFGGLDSVPERDAILKNLPTRKGRPFDTYEIDTTRALMTSRLHNGGYPDAEVLINSDTRPALRRATVAFAVSPGPRMHLGPIKMAITPRQGATRGVSDAAARRVAGLREGDLYSQQQLERAKRTLIQTEAFARVLVIPDSVRTKGDSTVPVSLQLTEGYMHETHAGVGYGTLDCFRTTTDYTHFSLLQSATRLDLHAKLSKIGVGAPLTGLESLCPIARSDLYSKNLNYYAGGTISRPAIVGGISPSFSLYSERRSEFDAYLRTTPVGGNITLARGSGRVTTAVSYSVEYGRTEAQPALLCAVFNACEPSDRESVQRLQRLAVASFSISRDGSDNAINPTNGTVLRFEFRTAGAYTGSDPSLHFNKLLADGSYYKSLGRDVVLAARVRLGAVLGSGFGFSGSSVFIPQQERLFAGGQTTVRGFQQNELGPAVYIPVTFDSLHTDGTRVAPNTVLHPGDTVLFRAENTVGSQRTIPTGGNALAVGMLEARVRSPFFSDVLQWAFFIDGGAVWNVGQPGESIGFSSLRWTPGFGARFHTGIGVLRVDFAYNPYRPPAGAAYYDAPVLAGGALYCVSPDNKLAVTVPAVGAPVQAVGACPRSFQPPLQKSWFKRFAFVLTLGEAF